VNGFCICDFSGADDGRNVQVAFFGGGWANTDRFIGQFDVLGIGVSGGVHRHGFDAQFPAGPQNAQGDFASVGDQDFSKHGDRLPITR